MSRASKQPRSADPPVETRLLILDGAERLISLKGVYGFTLKDIADPMGLTVPAIYKHYKNRDDVLVALSRRFINQLAQQFEYADAALQQPVETLRKVVQAFLRFHLDHPAYVRLSLIDFATPEGGMEYVRMAAGGTFRQNLNVGPLAPMHQRLRELLTAGHRAGVFRSVPELDVYRLIKSTLLIRLVFPDDLLTVPNLERSAVRAIEQSLWDTVYRFVNAASG